MPESLVRLQVDLGFYSPGPPLCLLEGLCARSGAPASALLEVPKAAAPAAPLTLKPPGPVEATLPFSLLQKSRFTLVWD